MSLQPVSVLAPSVLAVGSMQKFHATPSALPVSRILGRLGLTADGVTSFRFALPGGASSSGAKTFPLATLGK